MSFLIIKTTMCTEASLFTQDSNLRVSLNTTEDVAIKLDMTPNWLTAFPFVQGFSEGNLKVPVL